MMEFFKRPVTQMQDALDVLYAYPEHRDEILTAWFGVDVERLPELTRKALGHEYSFSRDDITQDILTDKDSSMTFKVGQMKHELAESFESSRRTPIDQLREAISRQLTLFDDERDD